MRELGITRAVENVFESLYRFRDRRLAVHQSRYYIMYEPEFLMEIEFNNRFRRALVLSSPIVIIGRLARSIYDMSVEGSAIPGLILGGSSDVATLIRQ